MNGKANNRLHYTRLSAQIKLLRTFSRHIQVDLIDRADTVQYFSLFKNKPANGAPRLIISA